MKRENPDKGPLRAISNPGPETNWVRDRFVEPPCDVEPRVTDNLIQWPIAKPGSLRAELLRIGIEKTKTDRSKLWPTRRDEEFIGVFTSIIAMALVVLLMVLWFAFSRGLS